MGIMVTGRRTEIKREAIFKEAVVIEADVEGIKIEAAGRVSDPNPMIEVDAIRKAIWAGASISIFTLILFDLPN
jgi:hypothetical protein